MTPKKRTAGITRQRIKRYIDVVFAGRITEFARFVGVTQSTISRIVSGDRLEPRVTTVQRIATGMRTQMAWLMGDMDTYPRDDPFMPEWYNMLSDHHHIVTAKDYSFLESIEGLSGDTQDMIRTGLENMVELAPLAMYLYGQFGPSAETGRAVEPFICAVRSQLESARLTTRIIVTELKRHGRRSPWEKRP